MKRTLLLAAALTFAFAAAHAADTPDKTGGSSSATAQDTFKPEQTTTSGSVSVEGDRIDYQAVAGTIVVHPKGWDDVKDKTNKKNPDAEASMFYVAYFKKGAEPGSRPITFLYNGGPGSASVWLHMGAFGPKRVVTNDDTHTPAAPYQLINNDSSLLDASDLVFIDAPGTGFSRIAGKDKEKSFFGVDQDAHAYSEFIKQFLSQYGRWNSPKYLFGESYGTTRSAALIAVLETEDNIDFNGVVLLSQILNYGLSVGRAETNPGVDLPYALALPTYAATAWYHHKLPGQQPADLPKFLGGVQHFAMGDYLDALQAGSMLNSAQRNTIANKLHQFTGLPVSYILKANLRIDGGEFEKNLQADTGTTTGRLDSRFSGPDLDPLSQRAEYDPQSAAISSAYVSAFNDYVRSQLNYGEGKTYVPSLRVYRSWDFHHQQPGSRMPLQSAVNVLPDLSVALKYNPRLKVLLNAGYFDLATPYYEGVYEMRHLQIPRNLVPNVQFHFYQSGHMVYAHAPALKELHDTVAGFIRATDNLNH